MENPDFYATRIAASPKKTKGRDGTDIWKLSGDNAVANQYRLATKLYKEDVRTKHDLKSALRRKIDIPLSNEMVECINDTFKPLPDSDDTEYREEVQSILTVPVDALSALCPTASLLASDQSAARIPYGRTEFTGLNTDSIGLEQNVVRGKSTMDPNTQLLSPKNTGNFGASTMTLASDETEVISNSAYSDARERMEVLWLQRRAAIEHEEGNSSKAMRTLDEALKLHLGTNDYTKAKLSEPVGTADPEQLLLEIEDQFLRYDKTSHLAATKIQATYMRYVQYRASCCTIIKAHYRGHLGRRAYRALIALRNQCAACIQRCYKDRLYDLIHPSANRIKRWVRMRLTMAEFGRMLFIYRRARRIQRLWRGVKGRRIAHVRDLMINGTKRCQRIFRGNRVRGKRLFAIQMMHRLFFRAAKRIQHKYRSIIAVIRAKRRLLTSLALEEDRMNRENEIYDETMRVEFVRNQFYIRTTAGKLHVADARHSIKVKDVHFKEQKEDMELDEILAHNAMVTFECFDSDGSGNIDAHELGLMLRDLSIPMTHEEVLKLADEMDEDGSGDINFAEFLQWYSGGGEDSRADKPGDVFFRQLLKARHFLLEVTGEIDRKRAEREVLRQQSTYLANDTVQGFRNSSYKNSPKYQCCQCMQPFLLFTDYWGHFEEGVCPVKRQQGIFYRLYWDRSEWLHQREMEYEILRISAEYPYLAHQSTVACFAEQALMQDSGVHLLIQNYIEAATDMFYEKLENNEQQFRLSQFIVAAVDICQEGILPPHIAKIISKVVSVPIPSEWIIENKWDLGNLEAWLRDVVDAKSQEFRLRAKNFKVCMSDKYLMRNDARRIATLYVYIMRMHQAYSEASLVALMDFRKRRPRKCMIPDETLVKVFKRPDLTMESYAATKNIIVRRLKTIHAAMRHLCTLNLNRKPPKCFGIFGNMNIEIPCPSIRIPGLSTLTSTKTETNSKELKYAAIGPGEDISEDDMTLLLIAEAHVRASAKLSARLRSRIGRIQIRRLANELWARRYREINEAVDDLVLLHEGKEGSTLSSAIIRSEKESVKKHFYFHLFSASVNLEDDTLDWRDRDIYLPQFNLYVKDSTLPDFQKELGNENGFDFEQYEEFQKNTEILKKYKSKFLTFYNTLQYFGRFCFNLIYQHYAKISILMNMRRIARLQLEIQTKSISLLVEKGKEDDPEIAENRLKIQQANETIEKGKKTLESAEKAYKRVQVECAKVEKAVDDQKTLAETKRRRAEKLAKDFEESTREFETASNDSSLSKEEKDDLKASVRNARTLATKGRDDADNEDKLIAEAQENLKKVREKVEIKEKALLKTKKEVEIASEESQKVLDDIEAEFKRREEAERARMADATSAVQELQIQLAVSSREDARGEERLLFRIAEDDAERDCLLSFASKAGLYKLFTERILMRKSVSVIAAMGHLIPRSTSSPTLIKLKDLLGMERNKSSEADIFKQGKKQYNLIPFAETHQIQHQTDINSHEYDEKRWSAGWSVAMNVLVNTFDTDCSGSFDEGEVRLFLQCVKRSLPERLLLAHFPEVLDEHSDLDKMVSYAVERVSWRRGYLGPFGGNGGVRIGAMPDTIASAKLLVSLSRQRAREAREKATKLKGRIGAIEEEESATMDGPAAIMRVQLLAMRQVQLFLPTSQGFMERKLEVQNIRDAWDEELVSTGYFSHEGLIRFAYRVHEHPSKGLLITELPHVIACCVELLHMRTTPAIEGIAEEMTRIRYKSDLYWLDLEEVVEKLGSTLEEPPKKDSLSYKWWRARLWRHSYRKYSKRRVYAIARQQAVEIALDLGDLKVAATNYRCSCLGLNEVIQRNRKLTYNERRKARMEIAKKKLKANFIFAPREAIPFLLLSRGYMVEDFRLPIINTLVNVNFDSANRQGELALDTVNVTELHGACKVQLKNELPFKSRMLRWAKFFAVTGINRYYEYGRVVRALAYNMDDINKNGAVYLKELLTGISHCIEEHDHDE